MFVHVLNSSVVAGLESLVLPNLVGLGELRAVIMLVEKRLGAPGREALTFARCLDLPVTEVPVRRRVDQQAISDLHAAFAQSGCNIVHAHDVKATFYSHWALTRRMPKLNVRLVSTHHGVRGRGTRKQRLYEALYTRLVLPSCDLVLTVSREDFGTLERRGLSARKLRLHCNGVDRPLVAEEARATARDDTRAKWLLRYPGLRANALWMGITARLTPEKRIDAALGALAELEQRAASGDWQCLVFGTGPLRQQLEAHAKQLGLQDDVIWCGYNRDLPNEMAGLDLLLSFSFAEGLPISFLEAGWAGTPVYASAVGGCKEVIADGTSGRLFPADAKPARVADDLAELLGNRAVLRRYGAEHQKRVVASHSLAAWLARLNELYGELT